MKSMRHKRDRCCERSFCRMFFENKMFRSRTSVRFLVHADRLPGQQTAVFTDRQRLCHPNSHLLSLVPFSLCLLYPPLHAHASLFCSSSSSSCSSSNRRVTQTCGSGTCIASTFGLSNAVLSTIPQTRTMTTLPWRDQPKRKQQQPQRTREIPHQYAPPPLLLSLIHI